MAELAPSFESESNPITYKESVDRWTQIRRYPLIYTDDERRETHAQRQEIQIDDTFHVYGDKILKIIEESETVLDGALRQPSIANI